jgi:hypothetical protein
MSGKTTGKELYYNFDSGIYCFFPFENFDKKGNAVFKIGNTQQSFQERLAQYHTYFIHGVWVLGMLEVKAKRGQTLPVEFKNVLNQIEDWVLNEIVNEGGKILHDNRRVWKQGQSEWVYSNMAQVKRAFDKAVVHFKTIYTDLKLVVNFVNMKKTTEEINASHSERKKIKNKYVGEYIFPL